MVAVRKENSAIVDVGSEGLGDRLGVPRGGKDAEGLVGLPGEWSNKLGKMVVTRASLCVSGRDCSNVNQSRFCTARAERDLVKGCERVDAWRHVRKGLVGQSNLHSGR